MTCQFSYSSRRAVSNHVSTTFDTTSNYVAFDGTNWISSHRRCTGCSITSSAYTGVSREVCRCWRQLGLELVRAVDSELVTALVLLDFSSAFDTVDHCTLSLSGVSASALVSCLSDRTHCVMSRVRYQSRAAFHKALRCMAQSSSSYAQMMSRRSSINRHQVSHHLYAEDKFSLVVGVKITVDVSVPVTSASLTRHILQRCISDIASCSAVYIVLPRGI